MFLCVWEKQRQIYPSLGSLGQNRQYFDEYQAYWSRMFLLLESLCNNWFIYFFLFLSLQQNFCQFMPLNKKRACAGSQVNKVFGNCFRQFLNIFLTFFWAEHNQGLLRSLKTLPRDSRNSMDSILWPIFGTAETSHMSPPDAILVNCIYFARHNSNWH